jgi:hypothetical protein
MELIILHEFQLPLCDLLELDRGGLFCTSQVVVDVMHPVRHHQFK